MSEAANEAREAPLLRLGAREGRQRLGGASSCRASVETVADLVGWLKHARARVRRGVRAAAGRPRGPRQGAREAGRAHRRRARDRLLSAGHRRLMRMAVRVQREDFDVARRDRQR